MPRLFLSPEIVLAVDPALLRRLFDTCGFPARFDRRARDAALIARQLWGAEAPAALANAAADVARFASPIAREVLVHAERDARDAGHFAHGRADAALAAVGAPVASWSELVAADLALRVVLARVHEPALEPLIERARIHLERMLPAQIPFELAAHPAVVRAADATPDAIAAAILAIARADGPWSDAFVARDDDGAIAIAVLRAAPADGGAEIDARGPRRVVRRALTVDVVRFFVDDARLSITTARPALALAYAGAIARVVSDDPEAFTRRPALTLKWLQTAGRAALRALAMPAPVTSVEIVALQLADGAARLEARGDDALAALAPAMRRGGYLTRGTFRFVLNGAARPVDAFVELPNRLSVSDARFDGAIRAALAAMRVFAPGQIADDVVTLAPWVHPEWRWRAVVGASAFDAIVLLGLLVRIAPRARARVAAAAHGKLGAGARAFALVNARDRGKHYAPSVDLAEPSRTVTGPALAMWKLDVTKLRRRMRASLGATKGGKVTLPPGVLDLGVVDLASVSLRFFYVVRAVDEDKRAMLGRALRRAAGRAHAIALVPEGRTLGGVVEETSLALAEQLGRGHVGHAVTRAANAMGIEDELEPWRWSSDARPLVFVASTRTFHFRRVRLLLSENRCRLLETLALAKGKSVDGNEVGAKVSPGAALVDQIARKTRSGLGEDLAKSFEAAGEAMPDGLAQRLVEQVGKGSYRLGVGCVVL